VIEYIISILALIPVAYDDYKDFLVDDYSWLPFIPAIPFILYYSKELNLNLLFIDIIIYIIVFIPTYFILKKFGKEFGEADLILYFILIFYEPLINLGFPIPDYLFIILAVNIIGVIYGSVKKFLTGDERIPLIAMSLPAIVILELITILKVL